MKSSIASVLAAYSTSAGMLLTARALMGIACVLGRPSYRLLIMVGDARSPFWSTRPAILLYEVLVDAFARC